MPIHDWTRVDPGIFHAFHQRWISALADALNGGCLPPDYYALTEQVTTRARTERDIPDLLTLHADPGVPPPATVMVRGDLELYRRKQSVLSVRHVSGDRVVAVIEIVSPGDKAGTRPFAEFVGKAVELLDRGMHLLLVDLLPPTPRDPGGIHAAVWGDLGYGDYDPSADKPLTAVAYEAGPATVRGFVEPLAVGDRLPDMPLILEPDRCVLVPLETTYSAAWAAFPLRWRRVIEPGV